MISEKLKSQTQSQHDLVEAKFNSDKIFKGTFTFADYRKLLEYNYLFLLNFENLVFAKISETNAQDLQLEKRRKLPLIESELDLLEIAKSQPDQNTDIKNEAEAFGILYVMEGSTLGGNMIAKQLSKSDDYKEISFKYFRCYGEKTGSFWKNFKEVLDRQTTDEFEAECLAGADKAYRFLLNLPD